MANHHTLGSPSTPSFHGLWPDLGQLDPDDLAGWYRPFPGLRVNMVSSLDGAATGPGGLSGSLGTAADRIVFGVLRDQADAILVGAATASLESYRPAAKPLVLISRTGQVPDNLTGVDPGAVWMITHAASPGLAGAREALGAGCVLALGSEEIDWLALKPALAELGWHHVLCEGGPRILGRLLAADQVDELCLTVVPSVVGPAAARVVAGDVAATFDVERILLASGAGQDTIFHTMRNRSWS